LENLDDLQKQRFEKLKKLEELGVMTFAYEFDQSHVSTDVIDEFNSKTGESFDVAVAGRLMSIRRMGKASFGHIMDRAGRIQIYIKKDEVGEQDYAVFKLLDIGDIVGIRGTVFKTRMGEITILVHHLNLLSKTLRPLPIVKEKIEDNEKIVYDAFKDKEMRYRQRYVDLIVNPEVKKVFTLRSRIISTIRQYLEERDYLEVETPVLQPLYGGAFAKPFVTHHNTLDMEFYLRIADELYLKRLIIGGFHGVFEISKDFRNEGMDRDHNPEFTMLELYAAYKDYTFIMNLVENMVSYTAENVLKKTCVKYQGQDIELAPPWKRISYYDAVKENTGLDLYQKDADTVRNAVREFVLDVEDDTSPAKLVDEVFSLHVEPKLIQPTFVIDFPLEVSPLAKKHRSKAGLVERFEGYIAGKELCNAFSELNDPLDQRDRFTEQAKLKAAGDEEAMIIDDDYLRAMEYGMPPTGGLGIGIDRLVMMLTDAHSIRDVILFPQMRPEKM